MNIKSSKNNKEAILESSLKLFRNKGFANTSIKEIAAEAGVSQGNIYNHFSSKTEIFDYLFREHFPGNFIGLLVKGVSHGNSIEENIENVIDNIANFVETDINFFRLMIIDANEFGNEHFRRHSMPFNKPIEDFLIGPIKLPGLRRDINSIELTQFFGWLLYAFGLTDIIYRNSEGKNIRNTAEYNILIDILKKGLKEN